MHTPIVIVDGRHGSIFEGEIPGTFCFVPQDCIFADSAGVHVNEIEYIHSGWDVRNMRFSDATDGQHLFPKSFSPVTDLDAAPVRDFLDRIKLVHCA